MPSAGFETEIPTIVGQQNYPLDRTAIWLFKKYCAQLFGHYQLINFFYLPTDAQ
jgi:hypothetical protein